MKRIAPLLLLFALPLALGATAIQQIVITDAGRELVASADAAAQRLTLGLGTIATQDADGVVIIGGAISGITDIAIEDGGTGASTAADARDNLGLTIGTHIQTYDADLTTYAGISPSSNIQTLLGSADYATARINLDVLMLERSMAGPLSPSDNTTYYFGRTGVVPTTTEGANKIYFPFACTIKAATFAANTIATLGSDDTFTVSIRKNGSSDTTITSAAKVDAINRIFRNPSVNLSIAADDYIEFKAVAPTNWSTNPTNTNWSVLLEISR